MTHTRSQNRIGRAHSVAANLANPTSSIKAWMRRSWLQESLQRDLTLPSALPKLGKEDSEHHARAVRVYKDVKPAQRSEYELVKDGNLAQQTITTPRYIHSFVGCHAIYRRTRSLIGDIESARPWQLCFGLSCKASFAEGSLLDGWGDHTRWRFRYAASQRHGLLYTSLALRI